LCPLLFIMNNIQGHLQKLTHKYCLKSPKLYRNKTKNAFWSRFWKHKKVLETPLPAVGVDTDSTWDANQFCDAFMLFYTSRSWCSPFIFCYVQNLVLCLIDLATSCSNIWKEKFLYSALSGGQKLLLIHLYDSSILR
jgi:hypothetical protein